MEKIHDGYSSYGASANDFKYDPNRPAISPETIDMHAARSHPLCMKVLHKKLRETHHLRHGGRLQYSLFLKGIGLKLDDAMAFWRNELGRVKNFDTNYAYNIR